MHAVARRVSQRLAVAGVVATTVVAGLVVPTSSASQTPEGSAVPTAASTWQSDSASAAGIGIGTYRTCGGTEVRRCVWFNFDFDNDRVRAYAKVTDVKGGRNFMVLVRSVRLQWWDFIYDYWRDVARTYSLDADGWHDRSDTAVGQLRNLCASYGTYRVLAYFEWSPGHGEWFAGEPEAPQNRQCDGNYGER